MKKTTFEITEKLHQKFIEEIIKNGKKLKKWKESKKEILKPSYDLIGNRDLVKNNQIF